ncbi:hypothetical protein DFH08DRAFT_1080441 [Mycena albidolilacea]|uniref:Uncharacterized protein n=1 Tax=Mycena albidolilacea TaxID=1033008 RepID=A0AAD7ERJ3_9AGAR|nr:hypothetical protein DFH08DRAFT_1080441 [Mycena albidolilacea]
MATPSALEAQEICDYICDFLHGSPTALTACSLVSTVFTSSAQRHLFDHIDLTDGTPDHPQLGGPVMLRAGSNVVRASNRLRVVLEESPHLIRFIRCLKISFDEEVLAHFTQVPLTHVETIVLRAPSQHHPHPNTVSSLAAPLIALPSVRNLKLILITFEHMESLRILTRQRTSLFSQMSLHYVDVLQWPPMESIAGALQQHIVVKELDMIGHQYKDSAWLIHPLSPFNFSTLERFNIQSLVMPSIVALMRLPGSTLHTLGIDAHEATTLFRLDDFIWLKDLDILGSINTVYRAAALLESAGSAELRLEHIIVRVCIMGLLDQDSLSRADDAIADMNSPHLRGVEFQMSMTTGPRSGLSSERFVRMVKGVREMLPRLNARGYLRVSCVYDGMCIDL